MLCLNVHEEKKPFKCEMCHHTCAQKGHLKKHVESAHGEKRSFKYDFAQKNVTTGHEGKNLSSKITT